ncbi:MAG: hypothetical protein ABI305_06850 [Tepidiformaceae bacterium]
MRRHTPSFLGLIVLILAAALVPGAAVFARVEKCGATAASDLPTSAMDADVIVIARVSTDATDTSALLQPEAYLKGSASSQAIPLSLPAQYAGCAAAQFPRGNRVLVFLGSRDAKFVWPTVERIYYLNDGSAVSPLDPNNPVTEEALVSSIRSVTNEYIVPASSNAEGASLDWVRVVLPTTIVVLIVFGIGLVLMRIWHRIDPT